MKKTAKISNWVEEMRPEYDLASMKLVARGNYAQALESGHSVRVLHDDGTVTVTRYIPDAGTVILAPDVRPYFPDAEAVNEALRCLIPLVSKHKKLGRKLKSA